MFVRTIADPNFAIRWKIKILPSITWDLNGRKYRIRIGRYFSPIKEILFVDMEKVTVPLADMRRITNASISFPGDYLDRSRWASYRATTSIVYGRCCECLCVSFAVTVCSREKRIAREAAFPSIFFLRDHGLPLYPPSFLSRGQTSGT